MDNKKVMDLIDKINDALRQLCDGECQWNLVVLTGAPGEHKVFSYIFDDNGLEELRNALALQLASIKAYFKGELRVVQ